MARVTLRARFTSVGPTPGSSLLRDAARRGCGNRRRQLVHGKQEEKDVRHGFTVWLTGLSGAGKTTIAGHLERELRALGRGVEVLDGDVVRTHLSKGLGFSREDRDINILRIAFVSSLLTRHGVAVIAAAISPYADARRQAREQIGEFVEVYVRCPLDELTRRDVKGLYARALRGELANFTGVSDPYEEPEHPDVVVDTSRESIDQSVAKILTCLAARGYIDSRPTPSAIFTPNGSAAAAASGQRERRA
jgi:adenylyl-sulfate kinase